MASEEKEKARRAGGPKGGKDKETVKAQKKKRERSCTLLVRLGGEWKKVATWLTHLRSARDASDEMESLRFNPYSDMAAEAAGSEPWSGALAARFPPHTQKPSARGLRQQKSLLGRLPCSPLRTRGTTKRLGAGAPPPKSPLTQRCGGEGRNETPNQKKKKNENETKSQTQEKTQHRPQP